MGYFCIDMTKIFTIGFSGKSPEAFLDVLNAARISCICDIRQWRTSTYVPYYNGDNLANVLGNRYEYHPEFAPTSDILAGYKDKKITWAEYEKTYRELLQKRDPLQNCDISKLDRICLLCTEKSAIQCHRRLASEYIEEQLPDVEIVHL
jgi:uncharacterized protein (DUF488 family)